MPTRLLAYLYPGIALTNSNYRINYFEKGLQFLTQFYSFFGVNILQATDKTLTSSLLAVALVQSTTEYDVMPRI